MLNDALRRLRRLGAALWLGLALAGCGPQLVEVPVTVVVRETEVLTVERVVTATPRAAPDGPRRLVVCLLHEPPTLYRLGTTSPAAQAVFEALYDGLVDTRSYQHQAVAFVKLPGLADGDAGVDEVSVGPGDTVYDLAAAAPVTLAPTSTVTLAQLGGEPLVVDFSETPSAPTVQYWAEFTQAPGLTWEDGTPVTSADALFAFEVARSPDTPLRPGFVALTADYAAVDDGTVRWSGLPGYVAADFFNNHAGFLPRHAYGRLSPAEMAADEQVTRRPLAYGPFRLAQWVPGDSIRLERNPTYWRAAEGLPRVDELVFRFVPQAEQLIAQAVAGRCHVAPHDPALAAQVPLLRELAAEGELGLQLALSGGYEQIVFNLQPPSDYRGFAGRVTGPEGEPVFADARVRRALAHCLDRQALIDQALGGAGLLQPTYAAVDHPLYAGDDEVTVYGFDPERGLALLQEAGWEDEDGDGVLENGRGQPLALVLSARGGALHQTLTGLVQAQLRDHCQVDVRVELHGDAYDAPGPRGILAGRRFDLAVSAVPESSVPPCGLYLSSAIPGPQNGWVGPNLAGYSSAAFDAHCLGAQRASDGSVQAAEHAAAQRIWSQDLPALILFAPAEVMVTSPGVENAILDATASTALWNVEHFAAPALGER